MHCTDNTLRCFENMCIALRTLHVMLKTPCKCVRAVEIWALSEQEQTTLCMDKQKTTLFYGLDENNC